jgi:ubiquinone/menaquinone biosynthesis C-methylase UbiE
MGTARVQGELWGARVRDYADLTERAFRPVYAAVFDAAGVGPGTRLLDVGCGPGLAAQVAAHRGACVSGLDAAEASLAIARKRTPDGDFCAGEMEELPWPDDTFDVVTGFNSFQFAADPAIALGQVRRVTRPGGRVALVIWGGPDDCEITATAAALFALLPPAEPAADDPFAPGAPERIEALLEYAGLSPLASGHVDCPFEWPNLATAVRAYLSAGPFVAASRQVGVEPVRRAIVASLAPFRIGDGGYRQRNRLRYFIASA